MGTTKARAETRNGLRSGHWAETRAESKQFGEDAIHSPKRVSSTVNWPSLEIWVLHLRRNTSRRRQRWSTQARVCFLGAVRMGILLGQGGRGIAGHFGFHFIDIVSPREPCGWGLLAFFFPVGIPYCRAHFRRMEDGAAAAARGPEGHLQMACSMEPWARHG